MKKKEFSISNALKLSRIFVMLVLFSFFNTYLIAQKGSISSRVYDAVNNEGLAFANVIIQGSASGVTTDLEGNYKITDVDPGLYNIEASYVGYKNKIELEVKVISNKSTFVNFGLEENSQELGEIVVQTKVFEKKVESPISLRTIGVNEIERNPGGNRDISRVVQTLPGVTPTPAFRNDLIIRGGSPNENRFYLDGIEIPNINHFATQGASGGPVGMINVNFIREVEFYSGAFPANRGNALSSVMEFKQRNGNRDKFGAQATVGATDIGVLIEGPIGKKIDYMFSFRRSYLQFLFQQIGLPFLPIYNDLQFRIKLEPSEKDHITIIGLGAIDNFELNMDANETREQRYILNNLPISEQWNYTRGVKYTRFHKKSYTNIILSRNKLNNTSVKYENNDDSSEDNLILNYSSVETENKLRIENVLRLKKWRFTTGLGYENALYTNNTFVRFATPFGVSTSDFESELFLHKYAAFGQASTKFFDDKLLFSFGVRVDGTNYSKATSNPLDQLSPRVSFSYALNERFNLNFNTGQFYQLPAYTVLGYRDSNNKLVNKTNGIKYIRARHIVAGIEYNSKSNSRITVEGFYKHYNDYPFLTTDSVSLANLGGDFGVVGNEPATPESKGRSYGFEFLLQQKLFKGFYGIFSYTLLWSEFTDKTNTYKPSAWDNRHIISLTAGKKFKKNWEIGARWWFVSGGPYTPYNVALSSQKNVWDVTGRGIPDYDKLNEERLGSFNQLDVRVDKKYYFNKWNLNVYFDVQNAFSNSLGGQPNLDVDKDENGNKISLNDNQYQLSELQNNLGTLVPSLGLIVEF